MPPCLTCLFVLQANDWPPALCRQLCAAHWLRAEKPATLEPQTQELTKLGPQPREEAHVWKGGNWSVTGLGPSELNILGGDRPDCTCVNTNLVVNSERHAGRSDSRKTAARKLGQPFWEGGSWYECRVVGGGAGSAVDPMGAKGPLGLRKSGV